MEKFFDDSEPIENKAEIKARLTYILDLRQFFNTQGGKRFLREVLDICGTELNPYSGEETPYFLGRASVGRDVLSLIKEADPTIYPRMLLDEAKKEIDDAK